MSSGQPLGENRFETVGPNGEAVLLQTPQQTTLLTRPTTPLTFILCHGSWQRPECWDDVSAMLRLHGHNVITPDFPATDASKSYEAYAIQAAVEAAYYNNFVIVGHSGGTNVVPRAANILLQQGKLVRKLISVGGSFRLDTLQVPGLVVPKGVPPRNPRTFTRGIIHYTNSPLTEYSKVRATFTLYSRCFGPVLKRALDQMRGQRRGDETPITKWPGVEFDYILNVHEKVINHDWSEWFVKNVLHGRIVELPDADHCPNFSTPQALTTKLLELSGVAAI